MLQNLDYSERYYSWKGLLTQNVNTKYLSKAKK